MFCNKCGAEVKNDFLFCPACGAAQQEATPQSAPANKRSAKPKNPALIVLSIIGGIIGAIVFIQGLMQILG